jgi:hypothetical protein
VSGVHELEEYQWIRRSLDYWERWRRLEHLALLEPIPNAAALLQAIDESAPVPSAQDNVQVAQFYHHHHHHHHHSQYRQYYDEPRVIVVPPRYRRDRYHHHHHHHHHHHSFYRRDY